MQFVFFFWNRMSFGIKCPSRDYCECRKVLYPNFCSVILATYGWALSWSTIMTKLEFMQKSKCITFFHIIIILSCYQHGYPWPSLATRPYCSSLPAGPQGYTLYSHRAAVCRFKLVTLLLLSYVKGFIGVHHLWARLYFSSSVLHVWFV